MCWSGEASAAIATLGFVSSAYAAYKGESKLLWFSLVYFSLMEALQAFTYSVITQCNNPSNQVATLLGYIHICFQPFFINAVALYFIPKDTASRIAPVAYTLCFVSTVIMLLHIYPFEWAQHCLLGDILCGRVLCSIHGNWHIAWLMPFNQIGDIDGYFPWYYVTAFLIPLIYGSWRWTLYHLVTGPILARLTTSNLNEWPAVWCLLSIDLLLIITNTRLRKFMYVNDWWLWNLVADCNRLLFSKIAKVKNMLRRIVCGPVYFNYDYEEQGLQSAPIQNNLNRVD